MTDALKPCHKPGCGARNRVCDPCTDGDCPQQYGTRSELIEAGWKLPGIATPSPWLPVPETPTPGVAPFDGEMYLLDFDYVSGHAIGRWTGGEWFGVHYDSKIAGAGAMNTSEYDFYAPIPDFPSPPRG